MLPRVQTLKSHSCSWKPCLEDERRCSHHLHYPQIRYLHQRTNIRIPFFLHMQRDGRKDRQYSWLLTLGVVTSTSQTAWLYSRLSHFLSFPLIFVRLGLDSQKLLSVKSVRTAASVHSWILVLQTIWPSQRTPETLSHLLLPNNRICSNEPHSDHLLLCKKMETTPRPCAKLLFFHLKAYILPSHCSSLLWTSAKQKAMPVRLRTCLSSCLMLVMCCTATR